MYVLSVLSFLVQLEPLPPEWGKLEERTLASLIPGPSYWTRPKDPHQLKDLSMPQNAHNLSLIGFVLLNLRRMLSVVCKLVANTRG